MTATALDIDLSKITCPDWCIVDHADPNVGVPELHRSHWEEAIISDGRHVTAQLWGGNDLRLCLEFAHPRVFIEPEVELERDDIISVELDLTTSREDLALILGLIKGVMAHV